MVVINRLGSSFVTTCALTVILFFGRVQGELFLGSLSTRAHDVAGDVYLLSPKVIEIRGFTFDGDAPAAYFWADTRAVPSSRGSVLSDGSPSRNCAVTVGDPDLPGANGVTQRVEFPGDLTIFDFVGGSLSVWCEAFNANFGSLVLPTMLMADQVPNDGPVPECSSTGEDPSVPEEVVVPDIAKTPEGYNCEPMSDNFQVRWRVNDSTIDVELVGDIPADSYMSFGVSGQNDRTQMVGADIVVADLPSDGSGARARDYHMNARAQCSNIAGVCSDVGSGFTDDIAGISGESDFGLTLVRYSRPLVPSDINAADAIDKSIPVTPGLNTFIAWALGPIDPNSNDPFFHSLGFARSDGIDVSLDFGRQVADNCTPLATQGATPSPTPTPPPPFRRPLIGDDETVFDLHIGPSGGPRGFTALTGFTSWGIAWYVNGFLIPELVLRRGTKYTFRINGGNDPTDGANYHPFYLTDSKEGGYIQLTPEERAKETTFAGITVTETDQWGGVIDFDVQGLAPICVYKTTAATESAQLLDFEDFFASLDTSCATDEWLTQQAGIIEFTPDVWTPDEIFYHCVTHKNLGFKIRVIDADAPEATLAPTASPTSSPPVDDAGDEVDFTIVGLEGQIADSSFQFKFNPEDPRAGGQDTISVVFEAPVNGWVASGVSNNGGFMVGSEAVIGLPDTGEVKKYSLNAQSVPGVVPLSDDKQTLIDASVVQQGGKTVLRYTKILDEPDEIKIDINGDNTFLSAWGSSNTLGFHAARGSFLLSGESIQVRKIGLWKVHGWMAAIAWGLLSPLAIAASVLRRFFPDGMWFKVHQSLNGLVVLLTLAAFVVALVAINQETPPNADSNHFDKSFSDGHRLFGLIIFILAMLQGIGGAARPHPPHKPEPTDEEDGKPESAPEPKSLTRTCWEIGHRVVGLGILAFCWYQVQLGIKAYGIIFNEDGDTGAMLPAFWAVAGTLGALILGGYALKVVAPQEK